MTPNDFGFLMAGLAIGYVLGSLFYRSPLSGGKYQVTEITSADIVRSLHVAKKRATGL